jgi:hypothetical protein
MRSVCVYGGWTPLGIFSLVYMCMLHIVLVHYYDVRQVYMSNSRT